jgi:hypothetical protein
MALTQAGKCSAVHTKTTHHKAPKKKGLRKSQDPIININGFTY